MLIFLYGSDGYRLKENVDIIVGSYQKKHKSGVNLYRFSIEDGRRYDELDSAPKSVSFFDEAKLIIVKNVFDNRTHSQTFPILIKELGISSDKNTVLLFVENKNKKELQKADKELFSVLDCKDNLVKEIEPLSGVKLSNWVKNKFKENGHDVSPAVASLLISIVGSDSWALANEISKLSNYNIYRSLDSGWRITEKDVNLLVSRKEDDSIFELTDAVGNQNRAKAFEMMYRLTNSGHDPHYLLSMLAYHFENLLSVSDGSTPKHLHPFVVRKAISQARKFSKEDLLSKFNHLAGLDISSKNGQVNLEDALYNFVIN